MSHLPHFDTDSIKFDVLKRRAYNYRWAEVPDGVIPLTAADPDFPAAPEIVAALRSYVDDGCFPYAPKLGYESFRTAIADALWTRKRERIDPELILPIDSAARGMFVIARALLKPGDEMIVFDPCDFLFREAARAAGAVPVMFPARLSPNGEIDISDLESYLTPRTKMIGLCNPHNPYGAVCGKAWLEQLMELCERHDLYIMNDEIWSDIVYSDARFTSIYELGNERCKRVLSVFGFSKSFALAGLRIGCVYGTDQELFERVVAASDVMSTAGGVSSLSQVAGEAACSQAYGWVDAFVSHLQRNRDQAVEAVNAIDGLSTYAPQATYLLYVDISELGLSGEEFVSHLLETESLAIIPGGRAFFGERSEHHVRICFATSSEILMEGLERLRRGVLRLRAGGSR